MKRREVLKLVKELFFELEDEHPAKSTAWLFQLTCEEFRTRYKLRIDHGDVAEALAS